MDEFTSIFLDLRVWVTIVLGIIVNRLVTHTPKLFREYRKSKRLIRIKKIRKVRYNYSEVFLEISKVNSYFIFFIMTCSIFLILLVMGPLGPLTEKNKLLLAILSTPVYISEIYWLLQDKYAKELVKASRCLHVTNNSTRSK